MPTPAITPPAHHGAIGVWSAEPGRRESGPGSLGEPLYIVAGADGPAPRWGGRFRPGTPREHGEFAVLAWVPPLPPERLGAQSFRDAHGLRGNFVGGSMANAIASERLVQELSNAGLLAFFGAGGPSLPRIEAAIDLLQRQAPGGAWGFNLIHSPQERALEEATVDLYLRRGVDRIEASAFLDLTPALVRYRLTGLESRPDGTIHCRNRVMAKVSREEVARKFLTPAPAKLIAALREAGHITEPQARMAAEVPLCDDLTAEADSGGHTDNRPLVVLLPQMLRLRDELCAHVSEAARPRVGAAGGIGTPAATAAAFSMGAAYVVGGSVLQACIESGSSDRVRHLLAAAGATDVTMAPAADMFEMGVSLQVLSRGTLFPVRARKLYQWYREFGSVEALPDPVRAELERTYFRATLEEAWAGCERFWTERDPEQLRRAQSEPGHRLALLFRSYLGQSSRWANEGVEDRVADYQIWCGPAMGAFNEWARGGPLEAPEARQAETVAWNLLAGAAHQLRVAALRAQGAPVPSALGPQPALGLSALRAARSRWSTQAHRWLTATAQGGREPAGEDGSDGLTLPSHGSAEQGAPTTRSGPAIAIVGIGAIFPGAPDTQGFWRLIRGGEDAVGDVPGNYWSLADYHDPDPAAPDRTYARRGAFLDAQPFDPTAFGIPPSILEATDTAQLLALVAAGDALRDAGCDPAGTWDRQRTSCILGVTGTQELVITLGSRLGHPQWRRGLEEQGITGEQADRVVASIGQQWVEWQENSFPGLLGNVVAGRIANRFDLGGTNCVTDAACASSLAAVHLACLELESGRADRVLSGGVDALNDIFMHMCFSKTPALSPTGDARPFAPDADGTILGEGFGLVVLRRLDDAVRDGDRVYAVIRGMGTGSDGRAKSIYAPLSEGQQRTLGRAYDEAAVSPREIGLIEAHGTGTKAGDAAEVSALEAVFTAGGATRGQCTIGSVKSQIGHTKAAAGAAGLIKAALALHHRVLPPTLKVDPKTSRIRPDRGPFRVLRRARPWLREGREQRLAGVSSFGFGGSDFHAVLSEWTGSAGAVAWDGSVEILLWSADSTDAVSARIDADLAVLRADRTRGGAAGGVLVERTLAQLARAGRERFSARHAVRVAAVWTRGEQPESLLTECLSSLRAEVPAATAVAPGRVRTFVGRGAPSGKLALLFPGQGAQKVAAFQDLACIFPEFLDLAEDEGAIGLTAAAATWPADAATDEEEQAQRDTLKETGNAQPSLALVHAALIAVLRRFDVRWDLCAGHSFGELSALHAASAFDATTLIRLAGARGEAMQAQAEGTMLAVHAPLEQIAAYAQAQDTLVLANRNTPEQGVLSGDGAAIDRAERDMAQKGWRTSRLDVGAAFHSPLVAAAADRFAQALASEPLESPALPTWSNLTGRPHGGDVGALRMALTQQISSPVLWVDCVTALVAAGASTLLEVGPRSTLTGMARKTAPTTRSLCLDSTREEPYAALTALASALAALASEGRVHGLAAWQRPDVQRPERPEPKMIVPMWGANHRSARTERRPVPRVPAERSAAASASPSPSPSPSHSPSPSPSPVVVPRSPMANTPPAAAPVLDAGTHSAWATTQASLHGLLDLQAQTAEAHRLFLEQQHEVQRALQGLIQNQQALLARAQGLEWSGAAVPAPLTSPPDAAHGPLTPASDAPSHPAPHAAAPASRAAVVSGQPSTHRTVLAAQAAGVAPASGGGPAPTPRAAAAPPPSSPPTPDVLLQVVSGSTGYPVDMIGLDMDMEADLGIDSIKRVEILSLYTERVPGAPQVEPEQLTKLRTLRQVLTFVTAGQEQAQSTGPASGVLATPSGATSVAASGVSAGEDLVTALLAVVAAATGYPTDMLGLDLDMEADLGIDSIKRVEILSLVGERVPGTPEVEPERLGSLRTLRQVAAFLTGGHGGGASPGVAPSPITLPRANGSAGAVSGQSPVSTPTPNGAVLPPSSSVSHSLTSASVGTVVPRREVWLRPCALGERRSLPAGRWWVTGGDPTLVAALDLLSSELTVLTPADDAVQPDLTGLVLVAPVGADGDHCVEAAFSLARRAGAIWSLGHPDHAALTVVIGNDGQTNQPTSCAAAGLAAFARTLAWEWPFLDVRVITVPTGWDPQRVASAVNTAWTHEGPTEISLDERGLTFGTVLVDAPVTLGEWPVEDGDLTVVTGGARGVTAACVMELARQRDLRFVLLGRSAAPGEEDAALAAASDEAAVKRVLLGRAGDTRPTPRDLGRAAEAILGARELRATLRALTALGRTVEYHSVDVADGQAVASVLTDVIARLGPVRMVVHGAGVLRDKRIEDKTLEMWRAVWGTKVGGLTNVLKAVDLPALRAVIAFGSVSGRFGRRGQCDYAAANRALVHQLAALQREVPGCAVRCLAWGPWDGGMVGAGLAREFEKEGVGLVPLDAGARAFVDELRAAGPIERVLGDLGDAFGAVHAVEPTQASLSPGARALRLDTEGQPWLADHRLRGRPVLPAAMMLEAFAAAAGPSRPVLRGFAVLHGLVLDGPEAGVTVNWTGGDGPIQLQLRGPGDVLVASAEALPANGVDHRPAPVALPAPREQAYPLAVDACYAERLFHGPTLRVLTDVVAFGEEGITVEMRAGTLGERSDFDASARWTFDPALLDGIFQAAILWCWEQRGAPSLPNRVERWVRWETPRVGERVRAVLRFREGHISPVFDVDLLGDDGRALGRIEGYRCTVSAQLTQAFHRPAGLQQRQDEAAW